MLCAYLQNQVIGPLTLFPSIPVLEIWLLLAFNLVTYFPIYDTFNSRNY